MRNYRKENANDSPARKAKRAANNRARRKMAKKLGVKPTSIRGDVSHKDNNAMNNSMGNLKVESKSKNSSFPRNRRAGRRR
jgi:phage terminase large subunit-like protein